MTICLFKQRPYIALLSDLFHADNDADDDDDADNDDNLPIQAPPILPFCLPPVSDCAASSGQLAVCEWARIALNYFQIALQVSLDIHPPPDSPRQSQETRGTPH